MRTGKIIVVDQISSLDNLPFDGNKGDYPYGHGITYEAK